MHHRLPTASRAPVPKPDPLKDEAWEIWTVRKFQFIRLKRRQAPGVVWRYAYALETKVLLWGGTLNLIWAKHDEHGGLRTGSDGAPLVALRGIADENINIEDVEEVEFSNTGFPYIEPAVPQPLDAPSKLAPGLERIVTPEIGALWGTPGFVFFCERTAEEESQFARSDHEDIVQSFQMRFFG